MSPKKKEAPQITVEKEWNRGSFTLIMQSRSCSKRDDLFS